MTDLGTWALDNPVPDIMIYKEGSRRQIQKFWDLAKGLEVGITVVGSHISKSIKLPVVQLAFPGKGRILLRDNFHSLEIAVLWDFVPDLKLWDIYPEAQERTETGRDGPKNWEWYKYHISRCEGYSWKGWSEAELADPRITRVEVDRGDGYKYWTDTTPAKKERWAKRWTDPEWHEKDWGGKVLWEGTFGPDATLYLGTCTFLEGIGDLIDSSARAIFDGTGQDAFTVSTSWEDVSGIITRIVNASVAR
jgi:hypothetical protein